MLTNRRLIFDGNGSTPVELCGCKSVVFKFNLYYFLIQKSISIILSHNFNDKCLPPFQFTHYSLCNYNYIWYGHVAFGHVDHNRHNNTRQMSVSSRARIEAYAGLLVLVGALSVLLLNYGGGDYRYDGSRRPAGQALQTKGRVHSNSITFGNADLDGKPHNGWLIGHFMRDGNALHQSDAVEVKWKRHQRGARNARMERNAMGTTLAVLVSGRHRMEFEDEAAVELAFPGDYVMWAPGVAHSWTAVRDSVMMCVRWPSVRGDQVRGDQMEVRRNSSGLGERVRRSADVRR